MAEQGAPSSAPTTVVPPRHARLAVLDGLRIVAALSVAAFHYIGSNSLDRQHPPAYFFPHLHRFAQYGFLGVELFFLISGFVICMSSWGRSAAEFVTSRAVRLYPAYWLAVLTTALVLYLWRAEAAPLHLREVLLNLTMMQDGFHVRPASPAFWTLWVELRFYLLFAVFVVWRGVTYRRVLLFCLGWLTVAVFAATTRSDALGEISTAGFAPYFVGGIAMYLMYRFRPTFVLWALVVGCWLISLWSVDSRLASVVDAAGTRPRWWVGAVIVTGAYAVLLAVALGAFSRIQWRWLTVAGTLTYPFYLLHHQIGLTVFRGLQGGLPPWLVAVVVTVLMLGTAYLVHLLVERPLAPVLKRALQRSIRDVRERTPDRPAPAVPAPHRDQPERVAEPAYPVRPH